MYKYNFNLIYSKLLEQNILMKDIHKLLMEKLSFPRSTLYYFRSMKIEDTRKGLSNADIKVLCELANITKEQFINEPTPVTA